MDVRLSLQHLKHKSLLKNDFRGSKMPRKLKKNGLAKRTEELLSNKCSIKITVVRSG